MTEPIKYWLEYGRAIRLGTEMSVDYDGDEVNIFRPLNTQVLDSLTDPINVTMSKTNNQITSTYSTAVPFHTCQICRSNPYEKTLYLCMQCLNWTVCEKCITSFVKHHDHTHRFMQIQLHGYFEVIDGCMYKTQVDPYQIHVETCGSVNLEDGCIRTNLGNVDEPIIRSRIHGNQEKCNIDSRKRKREPDSDELNK